MIELLDYLVITFLVKPAEAYPNWPGHNHYKGWGGLRV